MAIRAWADSRGRHQQEAQMFPNVVMRSGLVTEAKQLHCRHIGKHRLIVGNPPLLGGMQELHEFDHNQCHCW